uniref:Zn(2)-C6 fungal-type domain-containing protein n=1 Tax=Kwoniella bestiolae CBS 10118 TaxID=1296100 RepID=A0A1B9FU83_9TREE|nr:hypothetical protein I302_07964 [Kwoniella bestiolae CBS 10118]OCF22317.1 hypothetical protein I302_07964 [Kwoniella bestiolae CBS 10118]
MSPTNYTLTPGESSASGSGSTSSPYSPPVPSHHSHPAHLHSQILHSQIDQQNIDTSQPQNQGQPQRSRDGCLTCRARKVKCNEVRPVCDKCRIKSRECLWPSGDESERRRNKKRRSTNTPDGTVPPSSKKPNGKSRLSSIELKPILPSPSPLRSAPRSKTTLPIRPIQGIVHVPPNFLPPDALRNKNGTRADGMHNGDLVDWLVPDKARAGLMMDPSFLEPYFPTVDERLVIRHYLSRTVHIIIAFESNHRPWNPWITVHAPLAFKHLPGTNPAADALRSAILAVGGVHLTYTTNPNDQAAAWRITKSAKVKVLNLIRQTLEDKDGKPKVLEKENIELVLAALLSCTIASATDDSWHHLLSSVLSLIDQLGGAQNILQDAPRDRLSPYRFFMEQLAIRDVFGCMTTELAPSILQDAFTPWFFEAESWSRSDFEWESVERMFGISRGMVDMISRACNLIASVRSLNRHLPELALPTLDPSLVGLHKASSELMSELKIWDEAENFTPLHPRTQYGNHSYKHAIRIRMLRKVYNIPSEDQRVVSSSQAIIELAGEMLALYGKITWLTWPILIAGFEIPPSHPSRRTALEMLGAFGPHACFDNRAAARMLSDYWMWHDMDGDHATSWEVARTLNQRPFLD